MHALLGTGAHAKVRVGLRGCPGSLLRASLFKRFAHSAGPWKVMSRTALLHLVLYVIAGLSWNGFYSRSNSICRVSMFCLKHSEDKIVRAIVDTKVARHLGKTPGSITIHCILISNVVEVWYISVYSVPSEHALLICVYFKQIISTKQNWMVCTHRTRKSYYLVADVFEVWVVIWTFCAHQTLIVYLEQIIHHNHKLVLCGHRTRTTWVVVACSWNGFGTVLELLCAQTAQTWNSFKIAFHGFDAPDQQTRTSAEKTINCLFLQRNYKLWYSGLVPRRTERAVQRERSCRTDRRSQTKRG